MWPDSWPTHRFLRQTVPNLAFGCDVQISPTKPTGSRERWSRNSPRSRSRFPTGRGPHVLDNPPPGALAELRAVLLSENVWRQRDGLQPPAMLDTSGRPLQEPPRLTPTAIVNRAKSVNKAWPQERHGVQRSCTTRGAVPRGTPGLVAAEGRRCEVGTAPRSSRRASALRELDR